MSTRAAVNEQSSSGALLGDSTRLGGVELTVTDLDRSVRFYEDVIGLRVHRREGAVAALGVGGEDLVTLHEDPAAPQPGRVAGIYHFALLFPTREELARAGTRIARTRTPIDGASDHGTHEAIYLPDPDGIGIELAADRPRELWPDLSRSDFLSHGPAPLDVRALLETVADEEPSAQAQPGLRMGHIHLHVGDLDASTRFYRDGIGFEVITELPSAVFVSFARYHHHLAYNLWRGPGAPPAPAGVVGLRHWTVILDGDEQLASVRERLTALGASQFATEDGLIARDPANIAVRLAVAPAAS
jgi:catechol 2,3-dioxygenase